jgi:type III secretion protein U
VSEKTEPPSEKKLEDARKKGQVPQSKDLASAFAFLFTVGTLIATSGIAQDRLRSIIATALVVDQGGATGPLGALYQRIYAMATDALVISLPVVAAAVIGGIVGGLCHVGVNISFDPLSPKFEKLDPVAGVKKIFSLKSLVEVGKALVTAVFIGALLYSLIRGIVPTMVSTTYGSAEGIGKNAWDAVTRVFLVCAPVFLLIGIVDFVLQRLMFHKDQKMSKDDIKREYKQSEGDPLLKGQRKALAHELAMSDPTPAVSGANAVVVNPTHYAVALRYRPEEYGLPIIVAKGTDADAARIRAIAADHGIPVIGNPELARALFKVDTQTPVPEALLESVAIVLRWAEQIRGGEPA